MLSIKESVLVFVSPVPSPSSENATKSTLLIDDSFLHFCYGSQVRIPLMHEFSETIIELIHF